MEFLDNTTAGVLQPRLFWHTIFPHIELLTTLPSDWRTVDCQAGKLITGSSFVK